MTFHIYSLLFLLFGLKFVVIHSNRDALRRICKEKIP